MGDLLCRAWHRIRKHPIWSVLSLWPFSGWVFCGWIKNRLSNFVENYLDERIEEKLTEFSKAAAAFWRAHCPDWGASVTQSLGGHLLGIGIAVPVSYIAFVLWRAERESRAERRLASTGERSKVAAQSREAHPNLILEDAYVVDERLCAQTRWSDNRTITISGSVSVPGNDPSTEVTNRVRPAQVARMRIRNATTTTDPAAGRATGVTAHIRFLNDAGTMVVEVPTARWTARNAIAFPADRTEQGRMDFGIGETQELDVTLKYRDEIIPYALDNEVLVSTSNWESPKYALRVGRRWSVVVELAGDWVKTELRGELRLIRRDDGDPGLIQFRPHSATPHLDAPPRQPPLRLDVKFWEIQVIGSQVSGGIIAQFHNGSNQTLTVHNVDLEIVDPGDSTERVIVRRGDFRRAVSLHKSKQPIEFDRGISVPSGESSPAYQFYFSMALPDEQTLTAGHVFRIRMSAMNQEDSWVDFPLEDTSRGRVVHWGHVP